MLAETPSGLRIWKPLIVGAGLLLAGCDGNAAPEKAKPERVTAMAQVAAVRADSPDVKAFAVTTAQESASSRAQLARSVSDAGQPIAAPAGLSDHLQSMLSQLDRGTPKDFDKTYIEQQIEADEDALGLMSAYGRDGGVPAIKAAALALAPARQTRLDQARVIQDSLNKAP
jgi:predicted outer membrane protein